MLRAVRFINFYYLNLFKSYTCNYNTLHIPLTTMNASVSSTATTLCSGAGCMNSAAQSCPSCTVHPGIFLYCSQDCFKKNWSQHKLLHGRQKLAEGKQMDSQGNIPLDYLEIAYRPWSFQFSGSLRPYPVTPQMIITKVSHPLIKRPDYADDGIPRSEEQNSGTIKVNSPEEIKKMRKVCRLARQVLDTVASHIKPGITTDLLDKIVFQKAIELNCYPSPLNYRNFPKSVCTSVNEVICHGIPDLRPLKDGDILNIDVTLYHDGHHGDLNETYVVGESVDEKGLLLIQTTREALYEAIKIGKYFKIAPFLDNFQSLVKPGTPYKEIGNVIQKVAASRGFTVNKSYCGHGVNT